MKNFLKFSKKVRLSTRDWRNKHYQKNKYRQRWLAAFAQRANPQGEPLRERERAHR
jgi:hypothetical protein